MQKMLGEFVGVVRELSLDGLRDEALAAPSVVVLGERAARERVARALFGEEATPYMTLADGVPTAEEVQVDLVLCVWSDGAGPAVREALTAARRRGWPMLVINEGASPLPLEVAGSVGVLHLPAGQGGDLAAVRARLAATIEEPRLPSFGRHMPAVRPAVATALVQTTARANAQFAALSSLPAVVPFIGNLVGIGADFLVLTKNQLLLLYKLAAVYGRDLEDRRQLYVEMAPVVGMGLVWRTVAREVVGLVPGLLSAVPKVAIAYSGTYVVGRAAQYYFEEGRAPTRADWDRFYRQALQWWTSTRPQLPWQRSASATEAAGPGKVEVRVIGDDATEGPTVH